MKQTEKILELAQKNNGVILTKQVIAAGIGRWALQALEKEGSLTFVQRGVYVTKDGYVDDFFLLQQKYPTGIFSHETALYFHGLTDRAPQQMVMSFKVGTSTQRMKADSIRPVMVSKEFELGKMVFEQSSGTSVNIYNPERTLVDLVKPRYDADLEQLMPAFRKYASSATKDVNLLYRYAAIFGVEEKIRNYMGVLL